MEMYMTFMTLSNEQLLSTTGGAQDDLGEIVKSMEGRVEGRRSGRLPPIPADYGTEEWKRRNQSVTDGFRRANAEARGGQTLGQYAKGLARTLGRYLMFPF